jgi:transcriptional regulator with XRE-family HTH domain
MNARDEFVKMVKEEAAAWRPSDDEHLDEVEELLTESMISSGMISGETLAALERQVAECRAAEHVDMEGVFSRAFGLMMKERRRAKAETLENLATETGSDGLTLERIEEGRVNPSVLSPMILALWLRNVSASVADVKSALLLALQYVNRASTEPTASFARTSDASRRGRAFTRTEANEYLDRVSAMLSRE